MGWLGWTLTIVGLLIGFVSLVSLIGCFVPLGHVATRSLTLKRSPAEVYRVVRDGPSWPGWWDILKSVEKESVDGKESWRFLYKDGNKFRLTIDEDVPDKRLVLRIADDAALFGGTWVYEFAPIDGGCRATLTENGEIYIPAIRLVSRVTNMKHMYIDMNLKGLAGHFQEPADLK